jgi:hypothetical protein
MQAQAPRLRHPQCDRLAINDVEGIPAACVAMPGLPSNAAGSEQGLIDSCRHVVLAVPTCRRAGGLSSS